MSFWPFLHMGGYAVYVWPAYGIVLGILGIQLFLPWKRWRKMKKKQVISYDQ